MKMIWMYLNKHFEKKEEHWNKFLRSYKKKVFKFYNELYSIYWKKLQTLILYDFLHWNV